MVASPPNSRIFACASSAQRRMSSARSGSAETDGVSTNCWSVDSKSARWSRAHARRDFLSRFMGADSMSVAGCDAGAARIAAAFSQTCLRIDHHGVGVGDVLQRVLAELVAHLLERGAWVGIRSIRLSGDLVRHPLMMN